MAQIPSKHNATHGECAYWQEEVHSACGHWLHSNPGVQVMVLDIGKKRGSYVNYWCEFTDVVEWVWSELILAMDLQLLYELWL